MLYLNYGDKREDKKIYFAGDKVTYHHDGRNESVTGVIKFIDWDGSRSQVFADGIARAYVVGIAGYDFADYVEAAQLRPPGEYQEAE